MMKNMRFKKGDEFVVVKETFTSWGEENFKKGDILEIIGIAPLEVSSKSGSNGYLLSVSGKKLKRAYPRRFFENYCKEIKKD